MKNPDNYLNGKNFIGTRVSALFKKSSASP